MNRRRPTAAFAAVVGLWALLVLVSAWAAQTAWNLYLWPRGCGRLPYWAALIGVVLLTVVALAVWARRRGAR